MFLTLSTPVRDHGAAQVAISRKRPRLPLAGLSGFAADQSKRAYGDAQLLNCETTRGWFFWTYKAEYSTEWNFRDCVERGSPAVEVLRSDDGPSAVLEVN